jgi:serine/threonine protein kinase
MSTSERPQDGRPQADQPTILSDLNKGPDDATSPTVAAGGKSPRPGLPSTQSHDTQATVLTSDQRTGTGSTMATHLHVEGNRKPHAPDGTHRGQVWGDFRLGELLGRGGMGAVYKGVQISLDRPVAVKVLPSHLSENESFRLRFQLEAKAVAKLNSPHVIQVYGAGVHEGHHYFAMEYVEGEDLSRKLHTGLKPSYTQSLELMTQATRGLAAAGELGIVHRDIKPANMMVTAKGVLKLMDFGLVKLASEDQGMTMTGTIMGTVTYFSPEQGRGERCDQRTDIYAMGVVFYELLTGKLPFTGGDATSIIYQHIHAEPKPPKEIDPNIPEAYQAVALKCLQKLPEHRYQTAGELLSDLQRLSAGQDPSIALQNPTALRQGATVIKSPPFSTEKRSPLPWIAAAVAAAGIAGVAVWQPWRPAQPEPTRTALANPAVRAMVPTIAEPARPAPSPEQARSLLTSGQFDEARRLADTAVRALPDDATWKKLSAEIDLAHGDALVKSARDAFTRGDLDAAGGAAAAASALVPESPELKDLIEKLKARGGAQKHRLSILAQADGLVASGSYVQAEELLARLGADNPGDQEVSSALARVRAQRETIESVLNAVREQLEHGRQAMERKDFDSALLAYTAAIQLDPKNMAAKEGLAGASAVKQRISEVSEAFERAVNAKDLAKAEERIKELQAIAPGSSALVLAQNRLATSRLAEEEQRRRNEEREAKLSGEAKRLLERIDDPKNNVAALEQETAAFLAQAGGERPERALLERRLEDHRQRIVVSDTLANLDGAVRAKDAAGIAKTVEEPAFAEALALLAAYPGLVFESSVADFMRQDRQATAKVRIRHALSVFPERVLTYAYDLRHSDAGWRITGAHLIDPPPANDQR